MPALPSWLDSRRSQLPSSPTGLAPRRGPTVRSKRRALTGSMRRWNRMIVSIILFHLYFVHDPGQMLANGDRIRMLRSKRLLNDSEGPLPKHLGLLKVSLFIREPCQQIEVVSNEGVPRLQDSFTGGQCLLQQRLGLHILALL